MKVMAQPEPSSEQKCSPRSGAEVPHRSRSSERVNSDINYACQPTNG